MVVAATGFFDGVHEGHKAVLACLKELAVKHNAQSEVISFWPHPRTVLQKDAARLRLLTSLDEKREMILKQGIDSVRIIPFTKDFAQVSTHEFFTHYLRDQYHVDILVAGYNHRLGNNAPHNVDAMKDAAHDAGMELVEVSEFFQLTGERISSTKIRLALSEGLIETANSWLGYPYSLYGVVVEGNKIGRTIGFPTANMRLYEPLKQLPANGVYEVRVQIHDNWYRGMTNIGFRPTVAHNSERTIETHLFDFDEDIYGLSLKVEFIKHIRQEIAFPSVDALKDQLSKDKSLITSR